MFRGITVRLFELKQLHPVHFKRFAVSLAAVVLLGGLISVLILQFQEERGHIGAELRQKLAAAQDYYASALAQRAAKLATGAEALANDPAIRAALAQRDRATLLARSGPLFRRLRADAKITHLYFHDPNRINLLRVHQPDRHGDRIDRFTARLAEQTGALAWGVELGPLGTFTLRAVLPVTRNGPGEGARIGYLELGEETGDLLPALRQVTGLDSVLLIDKRYLRPRDWEAGMRMLGRAADWTRLPDRVLVATTLGRLSPDFLAEVARLRQAPDSLERELLRGERRYRGGLMPLADAGGRVVGELVLLRDVTDRLQQHLNTMWRQGAVGLLVILASLALLLAVLNVFQRRLDAEFRRLKDSRARLALAQRLAQLGDWEWDARQGRLRCSDEMERLLGVAAGQCPASLEALLAQVPPAERSRLADGLEAARQGAAVRPIEHRLSGAGGHTRTVLHHVTLWRGPDGSPCGLRGAVQDITAVRQAETQAQRLGRALETSWDEVYMFDPDTLRFVEVNAGASRNTGYPREELLQLTPLDLKRDIDPPRFRHMLAPLRDGSQQVVSFETCHWRKDGSQYPVEVRIHYAADLSPPVFIAIVHDISERRQAREQLQALARRLEHILDSSPLVHYQCRVEGERFIPVFASARLRDWGYDPESVIGDADWWLSHLHPDDRETVLAGLADIMLQPEAQHYAHDYRFRRVDGTWVWVHDELTLLRDAAGRPVEIVGSWLDVTESHRLQEALEHKALYDDLTDLPNRVLLQDRLQQAVHDAAREGRALAVFTLDVARLKEVNDTLGYEYGDRILCEVAYRLRGAVRQRDTVGRIGGDEFALVLPGVDLSQVEAVADKVFAAMAEPLEVDGTAVMLEVVLGIALWPDHGNSAGELLQHADIALRRTKADAAPMRIFNAESNPFTRRRLQLLADLRRALEQDVGLELYVQPKVDLHSGRVIGAEALARWQHPTEGPISPAEFIPLAEASGLILPFSDWALHRGIRQLADWQSQGLALCLAINLSARNLQEPELMERVSTLLDSHGVPADRLVLEITETSLMQQPEQARSVLIRLHDQGIRLSIDDFGTGYSSLAYLKTLPVDELKIDTGFVMAMLDNDNDAVLVRTIINLGHDLGLAVVAEGVENRDIADLLVVLGCDLAQGFYLARPMAAPAFLDWWQALPQDDDGGRFVPGLLGPAGSTPPPEDDV